MARTKQVYPSNEIPHLWFHGLGNGQTHARNSQGTLYFDGPYESASIFSYGSHFEIARKVTTKRGLAVLFNLDSRSVTTSGHQSAVRQAIPPATPVFCIPELTGNSVSVHMHTRNLESYGLRIESALIKAARARSSWAKQNNHEDAEKLTAERNAYVKFFGLRNKPLSPVPALDSEALRVIMAKESKRIKIESEKTKQANAQRLLELQDQILAWRDGAGYGYFYDVPTMLRVKDDELETSRGARIPMAHAKRALTLIRAVVNRGESWAANGHTCHVGHYQIDRIEADGTIKAGCHVIQQSEWRRIEKQIDDYGEINNAVQNETR